MKTILIATDFSNASRNASLYGIALARALNAKIILFTAYEVPQPGPGLGVRVSRYDVRMLAEQRLQAESDFLDPKRGLVETICDEGIAKDAILTIAEEKGVDFIIAGMKGNGKNLKKLFGSTATSLIKSSQSPVIIVPEETKFSSPKIILYASDDISGADASPANQIKAIKDAFESKLFVVKVVKDEFAEIFERLTTPRKLSRELKKIGASFEFPVDTDTTHALRKVIKKHHADMLVMMPHKHDWLERLFKKSETKDMAFHTSIPILVIPEKRSLKGIP